MEGHGVEESDGGERHNLRSLLVSKDRDFLVRNNGDQVKVSDLKGKTLGLYFSGSWCGPCRRFTPILVEAYNEIASIDSNFEVIFISADTDDEEFDEYFTKMPWLAIPFSDKATRDSLQYKYHVKGFPTIVIIDKDCEVLTHQAADAVRDYGADGYPFTAKKIEKLKEEEEAARLNQTITSLLVTKTRDFLYTSNFKKVPVSELEGKIVGLYFSLSSFEACAGFTRRLVNFYNELKCRGENFEIVLVSLEEDESSFMDEFEDLPWLGIPFKDKLSEKLVRYFDLEDLPTLTVIGTDGKTVNINVVELIEDYGVEVYPFTSKKLKELQMKERDRIETQSLESLLISGDKNFVNKNDGSKVPVSELVGKNIIFYFSAHWCPPCRAFLPHLIEVYKDIKEKHGAFEVIFISSDEDEESFIEYFSQMPWLALPFWDERIRFLTRVFKIGGIPSCVVIDPAGKTVNKEARSLIMEHGADAYPFTKEQIKLLKDKMEEKAKNWPEKIRHKRHSHVLWKTRREYMCDGCGKSGRDWSFYCKKCDFDFHPHCALDVDHEVLDSDDDDDDDDEEEAAWPKKIKHMLHKHVLVKAWRHYQCDVCGVVKQGYWSYFCEECDFDLHPGCVLKNTDAIKMMDDSDDESEDDNEESEDEDEDEDDDVIGDDDESINDYIDGDVNMHGGNIKGSDGENRADVEDNQASLRDNFKQALQLVDKSDGEDEEGMESKVESSDSTEQEDDDKDIDEEDESNNKDGDKKDELESDEDDDEDGPSMRGYVCNTRDREGSESFQDSLFSCKLHE